MNRRGTPENLKRTAGPGRPKGSRNRYSLAHKQFLELLGSDPEYRDSFWRRAIRGDSSIDRMILDHVIGKPTERVEHSGEVRLPTKVVFELHPDR